MRLNGLTAYVDAELRDAAASSDPHAQFHTLERAHILSQYSTRDHVRVHIAMLGWAWRQRQPAELFGQLLRIVGAVTKTFVGLIPVGNTGGANVSAFRLMPVPPDLAEIIASHRDQAR